MNAVHITTSSFKNIHFSIILPSTSKSSKIYLPFRLPDQNSVRSSPSHANWSAHFNHLEFIILYIFGKVYKLRKLFFFSEFPHSPIKARVEIPEFYRARPDYHSVPPLKFTFICCMPIRPNSSFALFRLELSSKHLQSALIIALLTFVPFNPLKTKRRPLYLNTQSVPRSKHFSSGYKNQAVYVVQWYLG